MNLRILGCNCDFYIGMILNWLSTGGGYGVTIGGSTGVSETTQLRL